MKNESLLDPKYMGGLDGAKGYNFENSYILSQLPSWLWLPTLEAFQQEGWSDVELFFDSGRRWLIQIKDHLLTLNEFREITRDFNVRESNNSGEYERYIIASAGLPQTLEQIHRRLNRFRDIHQYTDKERSDVKVEVIKTLTKLGLSHLSDLILEKMYFDSDIASIKNEEISRNAFIGFLVLNHKIKPEAAEDIFLRTSRLLMIERGKPIKLSLFHDAIKGEQLESLGDSLSDFSLITHAFLKRYEGDQPTSFFYTGAAPTWSDILHQRDITRDIMEEVLPLVSQWEKGKLFVPFTAEAGEGKSTFLRRLAVRLAADNKPVLFHRRNVGSVNIKEVQRVAEMSRGCIYIFFDDAPQVENFKGFIASISELTSPVVVIAAARPYEMTPVRAAYSANIELGLSNNGREYSLEGLSDKEIELLLCQLRDSGLIRLPPDEDIPVLIETIGKRTNRKFLALVLELTQGKRTTEIIRDEIERVRGKGESVLSAYRYICLMSSIRSYLTVPMLEHLLDIKDVRLDVIGQLHGLIRTDGERLHPRHDRIGEIATDMFFGGEDEQRGELLCQLISLAFEIGQPDVVRAMKGGVVRRVPHSQLLKVTNHIIDEAFCFGELDLIQNVLEDFQGEHKSHDIYMNLLAAKTPLIWEFLIFPSSYHLDWHKIEEHFDLSFLWPECHRVIKSQIPTNTTLENGIGWAQIFGFASWSVEENTQFLVAITRKIYEVLAILFPDSMTEICFRHAEFLREIWNEKEAIELYEQAIERNPEYADAHAGLSQSFYLIEDYNRAFHHYKIAQELDADSIFRVVHEDLFEEMLARLGELEELIEYRKGAVKQQFKIGRGFQKIFTADPSLLLEISIPGTAEESAGGISTIRKGDYSEEAERYAISGLDSVLKHVRNASEERREEIGKLMSHFFGELRGVLSSNKDSYTNNTDKINP
ncbi:MAG: hypothetical protein QOJ02_4262 [Acidobacteriota bacterium]|jgi:tetratricopeptide (TPR) repeat protein|nr:hypothetical protein [Acidobacteriota bacterium]